MRGEVFTDHSAGPESHVSNIDEGECKLHERCLVSGVPPCYRLVGEPSRKAAGRPMHHGHANRIGVYGTVQTVQLYV